MDQDVAAFECFNVVRTFFQASEPNRLKGLGIKNRTSAGSCPHGKFFFPIQQSQHQGVSDIAVGAGHQNLFHINLTLHNFFSVIPSWPLVLMILSISGRIHNLNVLFLRCQRLPVLLLDD